MVYLSALHRYQCFKCMEPKREEERKPLPWWIWLILTMVALIIIGMALLGLGHGTVGITNLTRSEGGKEGVQDALAWVVVIGFLGTIVAIIMEMKRERCPACGECLRFVSELDKYKCLHCGAWYPREDIEVEGFE